MDDIKEAKYIANEENLLEFPFRITGKVPHIMPNPDVAYLKKKLRKALLKKGAEKLFAKLLPPDKKSASPPGAEPAPGSPPTPQRQEKPEDIIQKTLEGIFGL